jgi:hypothetical protein
MADMKLYRKSILGGAVAAYKAASNGEQAPTRPHAAHPVRVVQAAAADRFFERLIQSSADLARETVTAKQ